MTNTRLQRQRAPWPLLALVPVLMLLLATGLWAQVQTPAGKPAEPVPPRPAGETLRLGIGTQPDQIELSQVTNTAVANLLENVVETLVTVDENGAIVPELAESWQVSEDGLHYTFDLRTGVTFQDGTPLDAVAVVWNFDRIQQINAITACPVVEAELAALQSAEATDGDTVQYNLSQPLPNFLGSLSRIAWGILSPRSVDLAGNEPTNIQHPVGTGPYAFTSLTSNRLTLTRFDGYRGQQPYYNRLIVDFVTDAELRGQKLLADELDLAVLPTADQIDVLARDDNYEVRMGASARTIFVALDNRKPPFDDVRVRQAVNFAVDKNAIISTVLRGAGTVMDAPVAPSVLGYCPSGPYDYDVTKAAELLHEAGVADNTPLQLLTPQGRYFEDEPAARAVAEYLNAVGFQVTVTALPWPAFLATFYGSPDQLPEMHVFGWAPTTLDAGDQLPQLYDSNQWPPFGAASSFYKNLEVEDLLATASKTADPTERANLFCQASQEIWADAPALFLWVQKYPIAYKAGLTDIVSFPNEKVSVAFARPDSEPVPPAGEPVPHMGE